MKFPEALLKGILAFRRGWYFRIFYLVVLSLMVAALAVYGFYLGCLSILMSAILMFALPYWLKERKIRNYALNGVVIFLAATLIFAGLFAQSLSGNDPVPVGATGFNARLSGATVLPGRGPAGAYYNFTANLTVPGAASVSNYAMWLNLTSVQGVNPVDAPVRMNETNAADTDLTDGKLYYFSAPLEDRIYLFWVSVAISNGTAVSWLETPWQVGPITTGFGTFFGFALYYGAFSLILPVSFYFIVLMLYWWTQRARKERQRLGMSVPTESTDSGFMCTNCGADVPAAATKCPKCGAVFEEGPAPSLPTTEKQEAAAKSPEEPESGEEPDGKD